MNTLAWTVYWIGVVISPIVLGMMLPNKRKFDFFDDGMPFFFLSLLWPFVIALAIVVWAIMGLAGLVGLLWSYLMTLGSSIGRKLEKKKEVLEKEDGQKDE